MTIQAVLDYLNQFTTPEELRAECVRLGVRGKPVKCTECVVARLIAEACGVSGYMVVPVPRGGYLQRRIKEYPLPAPVNAFALAFDRGEYPELVQE